MHEVYFITMDGDRALDRHFLDAMPNIGEWINIQTSECMETWEVMKKSHLAISATDPKYKGLLPITTIQVKLVSTMSNADINKRKN